ncbi:DNA-processing protein DprA [Staphylococcus hominis]|uniref:DNA-processing protein DprA n=1 Tax=Staphylococcus hominis TaxID=1290 RepID=UPI0028792937|nr:DNA-processing protein DprA [Staphylococcus hominis]MDS3852911.1 DNA-processing protein DprA [Staphylococcus hominis]
MNNIRSKILLLNQYGFSDKLLKAIYKNSIDPVETIFNKTSENYNYFLNIYTRKDYNLSRNIDGLIEFNRMFKNSYLFKNNNDIKVFFKYQKKELQYLIPDSIFPLFMYSKGNINLLDFNRSRVAIIGTRTPSIESVKLCECYTKKYIDKGYIIVSGLAKGIDTVAHQTALKNKGYTISVIPTQFNKIYPKENHKLAKEIASKGLLLSNKGPFSNTYKSDFLDRNKYVANISDEILVIETNLKSGTMNTIRNASFAKKKIYYFNNLDMETQKVIEKYGGIKLEGKYK